MTRAFVGLGSNIEPRLTFLRRAVGRLGPHLIAVSHVYETDPVGPVRDQPRFLNAVALLSWPFDAHSLLRRCLSVEEELGRQRLIPKGPRTIDLDVLLFGEEEIRDADLVVPHPELLVRAFAAYPVLELDPDVRLPSGELLSRSVAVPPDSLVRFPEDI